MDRRNFIKLTAVTGTSAALTACGNPEHQLIRFVPDQDIAPGISEWKPSLCPLGQAAIQVTYHPDRLTGPMKRSGPRGSGSYQQVSWDEAIGELTSRLDALADKK